MWSLVLLPGDISAEKVLLGILPDIVVFVPDIAISFLTKQKRNYKTRAEMMEWYQKKENKWKIEMYKWTHSMILWLIIVFPLVYFQYRSKGNILWYLFAAPLHILFDIPTHTRDSFPVQFLKPISDFQFNGFHWSNRKVIILNYLLIIIVFYLRLFVFGSWWK